MCVRAWEEGTWYMTGENQWEMSVASIILKLHGGRLKLHGGRP